MKLGTLLKIFAITFILLFINNTSFAEELNEISKIYVEKAEGENYNLNIFFKDEFTKNAFVQKKDRGSYLIYIPSTQVNSKKIKIVYQDKSDKNIVKISEVTAKNVKEKGNLANYAKFSVEISPSFSIRLIAKTANTPSPFARVCFFLFKIIAIFALLITAAIGAIKSITNIRFEKPKTNLFDKFTDLSINNKKRMSQKYNSIQSRRNAETLNNGVTKPETPTNGMFSCFDIPNTNETKQSDIEIKSNITRTAAIQSKQTNPITKNPYGDSELSIPVVRDLEKIKEDESRYKSNPVLLSELRITPNKGFYLTSSNDTFTLFGFVGEKIFILKKFQDLCQINLQARYYDTKNNNDLYILRLDTYKAIVEISENGIKELAAL